jgi:glutathione synthase/RimK-type ligase-like ATP-grasp enzyme
MNTNQRNVLLIAYDEHLVLSFVYCMRAEKNLNFYLLTHKPKSSAGWSRRIKGIHYYKEYADLETVIPECLRNWEIDVLMPIGELESLEVAKHRATFEKLSKVMPITEPEQFKIIRHKKSLNDFLVGKGLSLMSATLGLDDPDFQSKLEQFPFPALLKPSEGAFGSGIVTMETKEKLQEHLKNQSLNLEGYYLQEYVDGSDINFNVICKDGELLHYSFQESPPKSLGNYNKNDDLIFKDDPAVVEQFRPMLKALNYQGVACIDLRRNPKTGKVYLLEINARFWGSMMASYTRVGVNFPLIMYKLTVDESVPPYEKKEGRQISLSTYIKGLKKLRFDRIDLLKFWPYLNNPMARIMKCWYQRF